MDKAKNSKGVNMQRSLFVTSGRGRVWVTSQALTFAHQHGEFDATI